MAFTSLNKDELLNVALYFAVDLEGDNPTKKELLAALAAGDEPVTWEDYTESYLPSKVAEDDVDETPAPAPVVEEVVEAKGEENVLLKMSRANLLFEAYGYSFTKEHPFRPVTEAAAEDILREFEGFSIATPKEVREYYA